MPILNLVLRGDNLSKTTTLRTEEPIKLNFLKLNHVYHNLDSFDLTDPTDKAQQRILFVKFGNLLDSSHQTISYIADWDEMKQGSTQNFTRVDYDHLHGFLIGMTKHNNGGAIAEKELFQVLYESHNPLDWNGELDVTLYYLNKEGKLALWDYSNTYNSVTNKSSTSFIAFQFEYHSTE